MAKTKQQLLVENQTSFPNNTTNYITPAILRDFNVDMIQSMVDEIPFGEYTQSVDTSIEALNNFTASATGLSTGSLLVTASVVSNVLTFTKGDSSQFSLTVATGSGGGADITQLNQATASLQAFTASAQTSINALNTTTQSLQTQLTTIGGQSGSWITVSQTASMHVNLADSASNVYVQNTSANQTHLVTFADAQNAYGGLQSNNNFTFNPNTLLLNVTASNAQTASWARNIVGDGFVTTGSFNQFTASVNATTQSLQTQLATIGTQSGSWGLASGSVPPGTVSGSQQILNYGIFATTGSNIFNGVEIISGSVYVSGSVNLLSEGGNGWAFSSKALFLTNSVQTGLTVESPIHFYKMTKGEMYITANVNDPGSSGSMHLTVANGYPIIVSSSAFNVTNGNVDVQTGAIIAQGGIFNGGVDFFGGITQTTPYPGINLRANNDGSGSAYNISNIVVDVQTDPTNVFSAITVLDDRNNGNQIGIALNSYAVYPTATPMIYGGQFYSGTGTDCAMALPDDRIELWKPTAFKADLDASGSINVHSGSYNGKAINNITPVSSSKAPVQNIVTLSAAEYALITPNSTTLYIVI